MRVPLALAPTALGILHTLHDIVTRTRILLRAFTANDIAVAGKNGRVKSNAVLD
jgi:hypothetical protein